MVGPTQSGNPLQRFIEGANNRLNGILGSHRLSDAGKNLKSAALRIGDIFLKKNVHGSDLNPSQQKPKRYKKEASPRVMIKIAKKEDLKEPSIIIKKEEAFTPQKSMEFRSLPEEGKSSCPAIVKIKDEGHQHPINSLQEVEHKSIDQAGGSTGFAIVETKEGAALHKVKCVAKEMFTSETIFHENMQKAVAFWTVYTSYFPKDATARLMLTEFTKMEKAASVACEVYKGLDQLAPDEMHQKLKQYYKSNDFILYMDITSNFSLLNVEYEAMGFSKAEKKVKDLLEYPSKSEEEKEFLNSIEKLCPDKSFYKGYSNSFTPMLPVQRGMRQQSLAETLDRDLNKYDFQSKREALANIINPLVKASNERMEKLEAGYRFLGRLHDYALTSKKAIGISLACGLAGGDVDAILHDQIIYKRIEAEGYRPLLSGICENAKAGMVVELKKTKDPDRKEILEKRLNDINSLSDARSSKGKRMFFSRR